MKSVFGDAYHVEMKKNEEDRWKRWCRRWCIRVGEWGWEWERETLCVF